MMILALLRSVVYVFLVILFLRVILSWVVRDFRNPFFRLVYDITEPVLGPIRRAIPTPGGLDFSPMILMLVLYFLLDLLSSPRY